MKSRATLIVNSPVTILITILFSISQPAYSQITKSDDIAIQAKGNENGQEFVYSARLNPESKKALPFFQPGDEVQVSVVYDEPIEVVVWTQHWKKYAGKKCRGGGLFSKRKCKKTYHHNHPEDKKKEKPSTGWNIKIGLKGLAKDAKCTALDNQKKPQTTLNKTLVVNYPARLCIVGGGSIKKPNKVSGSGSPQSGVRLLRSISPNYTDKIYLRYEVKRKYAQHN